MKTGNMYLGGRSLSIGGPTNLLTDTPQNIVDSGRYNKSIAILNGVTKHDGSWVATGIFLAYAFIVYSLIIQNIKLF